IIEFKLEPGSILDAIDDQISHLSHDGSGATFIVVGREAYGELCREISVRNRRGRGTYETYNYIPIVVDPFRVDAICVLPSPAECDAGVSTYRVDERESPDS
ncbi:MAG: hypothetical protein R3282_10540, partial [Rhodothermales bacterium]|nr:hypothetical protein [Rhodothermales bacterium]